MERKHLGGKKEEKSIEKLHEVQKNNSQCELFATKPSIQHSSVKL